MKYGLITVPKFTLEGVRKQQMDKNKDNKDLIEANKTIAALKDEIAGLKEQQDGYKQIIDTMPILMDAIDEKGVFVLWNKECERVTGFSAEEILGDPDAMKKLYPEKDRLAEVMHQVEHANQDFYDFEWDMHRKDGNTRTVVWANISREIKFPGWTQWAVGLDITERVNSAKQIELGRERLKTLNKIICHDLANDFLVIRSAINIFNRSGDEAMISEIKKRIDRSLEAIHSYHNFETFLDSENSLNEIDIEELIKERLSEIKELEYSVKGKSKIIADDTINTVFTNLISNSINHGQASKIEVKITNNSRFCKIVFKDNGKGIPEDVKDLIFEEGFSAGENRNTGIGLFIVRKTIEYFGGKIYLEDNKEGATFVLELKTLNS